MKKISIKIPGLFLMFFMISACIEDKVEPVLLGTLEGVVYDNINNTPLEGAELETIPPTTQVFSDDEGRFEFVDIAVGDYTLIADADGFAQANIKFTISDLSTVPIEVRLSASNRIAPVAVEPDPPDLSSDIQLSVQLNWSTANQLDSLKYNLKVFRSGSNTPVVDEVDLADTLYVVEGLRYETIYFWQVDVVSETGNVSGGNVWTFETIPFPDNGFLFTTTRDGNYEIYSSNSILLSSDTVSTLVRLTETDQFELYPRYADPRDVIAFASNAEVDYHIYIMNKNGTGTQKITTLPIAGFHNDGRGFSWSPDNGRFAYSHYDKLYSIDRDGTDLMLLANARENRHFRACDWTEVDNKIVVEMVGSNIYDSEIYLMNGDGSDTVRIIDNLPGIMESPSFSLDGKNVLFTRDVSGFESPDGQMLDARIMLFNIASSVITDLSTLKPDGTNDLQPRFSPNGAQIIFINQSNEPFSNVPASVWVMDASGGDRQLLFQDAEMPDWK